MSLWRVTLLALTALAFICHPTLAKKDKIHLQWAICDRDYHTVLEKLGIAGQEPYKGHDVTYYDTAPPFYTAKGIGFRTKVLKGQDISMIKVRYDERPETPPPGADCVYDQYGHTVSYTCAMSSNLTSKSTELWSLNQTNFAEQFGPVVWVALKPYGPFFDPKWKLRVGKYKATFDVVLAEAGGEPLHLMEIEVKVNLSKRKKVYRKVTKWLEKHGVELCEVQHSRTIRLFEALDKALPGPGDEDQDVLKDWEL